MRNGKVRDTEDFYRVQCTVTKCQCQEYSSDLLTSVHCSFSYIILPERIIFHHLKMLPYYCMLSHVSRVRLCDPIDGSPPGSAVPGILQARALEWVAISFSNA